jgi:trans-aconitate 2-methyltransferase
MNFDLLLQPLKELSLGFSDHQCSILEWRDVFCQRNALELLAINKHRINADDRILDVGCGNGSITIWLAELAKNGLVVGVDNCKEVISEAAATHKQYLNVEFIHSDATEIVSTEKFDWIVSFNALHWLKGHRQYTFLECAHDLLKKTGQLLFTMGGRHEPIWTAIEMTVSDNKWCQYFGTFHSDRGFYDKKTYQKLLNSSGFISIGIEERQVTYNFKNQKQFEEYVLSWLPECHKIPIELKPCFLNDIANRHLKLLSHKKNEPIKLTFSNLEIRAKLG